jgi:acetyltransferase-like isoleucine patch superfamily enzyme
MNIRSVLLISVFKTLYLSIRFNGQIIVVRGTRIRLERGARIELAPGARLILGRGHHIGKPLSLHMATNGRLTIQGTVTISCGTKIVVGKNAHLEIGDQTFVHYDAAITCWEHIAIGADCGISWNTNIIDGNAHELVIGGRPRPRTRPLTIGDHVWIGTGAIVVGASIGDGSVVGAGSVVTTSVPPKALVTGNPAQVIREDVSWEV